MQEPFCRDNKLDNVSATLHKPCDATVIRKDLNRQKVSWSRGVKSTLS
jgi:hypothetical protein